MLQDRVLGGLVALKGRSWRVVLLASGELTIQRSDSARVLNGPALAWMPWDRSARLRARAGSVGGHLVMCETMLVNAIGLKPEAADLRALSERDVFVGLAGRPDLMGDVSQCFDMILREAKAGGPGAQTIIEAQVRVLLVYLWRHAVLPAELSASPGDTANILLRLRIAVETHFRDRWTVARYARELGMSTDRLHDICTRSLGKAPQRLVHERLAHEARVLLEGSSLSLDQIAAHLGFRSTPHFSAFFKRLHGRPPGSFRRDTRRPTASGDLRAYADWP